MSRLPCCHDQTITVYLKFEYAILRPIIWVMHDVWVTSWGHVFQDFACSIIVGFSMECCNKCTSRKLSTAFLPNIFIMARPRLRPRSSRSVFQEHAWVRRSARKSATKLIERHRARPLQDNRCLMPAWMPVLKKTTRQKIMSIMIPICLYVLLVLSERAENDTLAFCKKLTKAPGYHKLYFVSLKALLFLVQSLSEDSSMKYYLCYHPFQIAKKTPWSSSWSNSLPLAHRRTSRCISYFIYCTKCCFFASKVNRQQHWWYRADKVRTPLRLLELLGRTQRGAFWWPWQIQILSFLTCCLLWTQRETLCTLEGRQGNRVCREPVGPESWAACT